MFEQIYKKYEEKFSKLEQESRITGKINKNRLCPLIIILLLFIAILFIMPASFWKTILIMVLAILLYFFMWISDKYDFSIRTRKTDPQKFVKGVYELLNDDNYYTLPYIKWMIKNCTEKINENRTSSDQKLYMLLTLLIPIVTCALQIALLNTPAEQSIYIFKSILEISTIIILFFYIVVCGIIEYYNKYENDKLIMLRDALEYIQAYGIKEYSETIQKKNSENSIVKSDEIIDQ